MSEEVPKYGVTAICEAPKDIMKVKIKKLHPDAVIPTKAHASDAGFDLPAVSRTFDEHGNVVYGFGFALEIPEGYAGFIYPRSSIRKYDLALTNCVGIVDCSYRGEITTKFKPAFRFDKSDGIPEVYHLYNPGDRIAQLIIRKVESADFVEVDALSDTDRGTGGYGSTGT